MKILPSHTTEFAPPVPIKAWVDGVELEEAAEKQLHNVASLPFVGPHVAVMPDVHWGFGATVGSVIPTRGVIIPAAVGVDIGCGMNAVRTDLTSHDLPDSLKQIRSAIEQTVPHGRTDDGGRNDRGAWRGDTFPEMVQNSRTFLEPGILSILHKHPKLDRGRTWGQLGTLGTGNHFIEICLDESDSVWVMLHSGSRGVGNRIGTHFIALAKKDMEQQQIQLPDKDLAYLEEGSEHFGDYVEAVSWAQRFAFENRQIMMAMTLQSLSSSLDRPILTTNEAVNCHHNYISQEEHFGEKLWLTRKGAVSAQKGELGIIPGSMGAKSFIVRGRGNPDSFCSCSHGAGRKMSRTVAKKTFTKEDHEQATLGVECRKDVGVIDETPMAYKSIDAVMNAQSDLVEIVHTLKQIVCVKG